VKDRASLSLTPAVAIWETTRACDLRCTHCRALAMPEAAPGQLSTAEAFDLVTQLAELDPGVVVLTGGDPLKRPDLLPLIDAMVREGLEVAVTPSVTPLLTRDAIHRLAAAGVSRIALSLDGPNAAMHDGLRGVHGSFAATLAAVEAVRAVGLPLQLNTSLTQRTVVALRATGALVARLAPALWSVFVVVPVGRAAANETLGADACEEVFHLLHAWTATTGLPVKTTAAPAYRRVVLQAGLVPSVARPRRALAVNDGKGFLFVSHTGEVYPSGFLPLGAGNVRHQRLSELYRWSSLFQALRDEERLGGKCGACPFRSVCGGSRARAYAMTGDPFAADPACVYVPPRWTEGDACTRT
jgi:radical SAM protein with 4Fe4S-binding SPASM domain